MISCAAPTVTATARDKRVDLSWTAVAGTTEYEIFRTDGVFGCAFGKIKIATTNATTFVDTGLQNGRQYSYVVIAKGATDSCFGPASSCTNATPVAGPALATSAAASFFDILNGDVHKPRGKRGHEHFEAEPGAQVLYRHVGGQLGRVRQINLQRRRSHRRGG